MWRSMGVALLGLAVVACGDELAEGADGELVDAGQQAPTDAGASPVDAGNQPPQVVDAGPRPCTSCDAGKLGDAALPGGPRVVQVAAVASTCRAGETSGALLSTHCYSESELSRMGCVLGGTSGAGKVTTVATEAQMRATHWSLSYIASSKYSTYLCTGAEPTTDWTCGTPTLGDCPNAADQSSCRTSYLLSLMRIVNASCAN